MKINHILLPFDGSAHSINAAEYALDMAKRYAAHVTIVHCYEWRGNMPEVPENLIKDLKENLRSDAENVLKNAERVFSGEAIEYKLETVSGAPAYVLTKMAKSGDYDLIIMGSHGHSDIAGLFLGSVTHKVLNTIYCPVMIVP